ncbi:anthranilate synthase component I [Leptolyngbya sp. FACHB-261]|uniref:anthranilate synthase component I n=1 Tax=Leptolyngbya sp. FACHB-261 TaxID=2692806 RepID=UPI0016861FBF|nr:anthranilate synthase component I [Leptolyngbya sp. FACHB-261]MBD2099387.1 anthranilate synthase component I [Leptolyngbya sp. FACHB-261]
MKDWHWHSLALDGRSGSQVWQALYRDAAITTLLESPSGTAGMATGPLTRYSVCAGPPRPGRLWTPALGEILPFLRSGLATAGSANAPAPDLPFTGGWLGWLGYDLAWELEKLPHLKADTLPFPVAYWYEPESFAVLDHQLQILWLAATELEDLERLSANLVNWVPQIAKVEQDLRSEVEEARAVRLLTDQTAFETLVSKAKAHIRAGDIFQANLSLRFESDYQGNGWSLYERLYQINPSPFASYWRTPWGEVISASPERLVQLVGRRAQTRPIAGTRPRGLTLAQDQQLEHELIASAKESAEHVMLVDLERNDLGRVCEWGSVQVDELLVVERYSHVMHIVSNVIGTLRPNISPIDLVGAVFPGGTISGCPKVRCLEIVEALEPTRRSLFYGSCGYLDRRGYLDLNILIRTLLKVGSQVWGQVGAGIVADSNPEREWQESLHKAQAQLLALGARLPR